MLTCQLATRVGARAVVKVARSSRGLMGWDGGIDGVGLKPEQGAEPHGPLTLTTGRVY